MPLTRLVSATLRSIITSLEKNMYTWANSTFQWSTVQYILIEPRDWERFGSSWPPSHVWRLGFESPRTGYFFNMFLSLGLRSLRTLFLKFVAGLRHTMVLCYIAPIPLELPRWFLDLWPSLSKYWYHILYLLWPWFYYKFHANVSSATNLVSLGIPPGNLRLSPLFPVILVLISLTHVPLPGSHRQASPYLQCAHPSTARCPLQSPLHLSEINNLTLISVNKLWPTFRQCCLLQKGTRLNTF